MWERKLFYVFKVWSEVSPQAELCLSPEEEAQDRAGDCGPVRQLWAGALPGQWPGRGGGVRHTSSSNIPTNLINIASSSNIFKIYFQNSSKFRHVI